MSSNHDLAVVIMAGGAGTRFWPVSTEARPKQFLRLFGERSLIQLSYDRVASLVPAERVLVLTSQRFVPLVREQLPQIPSENVIGEPLRRDTAAAIALAALLARERWGDPVLAVLTADHLIEPVELFRSTLLSAAAAAASNRRSLYTFGVEPTYAATGYGYLQRGARLTGEGEVAHYQLLRFREKPPTETARAYLESGEYYWNSGMFVWATQAILAELAAQLPGHLDALTGALRSGPADRPAALAAAFQELPAISIDYGVMEHAADVRCVASSFQWSDVGGWLALADLLDHDDAGNAHRGALHTHRASDNLVFCEDQDEQVALVGVSGLVVVRAGRSTLVVPRERAEEVRRLVASLPPELR